MVRQAHPCSSGHRESLGHQVRRAAGNPGAVVVGNPHLAGEAVAESQVRRGHQVHLDRLVRRVVVGWDRQVAVVNSDLGSS